MYHTINEGVSARTGPVRVLMVTNNWIYGGRERVVEGLCRGFRDSLGWDVTLVVARRHEASAATAAERFPEPQGIAVRWLETRRLRGMVFPLGHTIRELRPDVIFWHADVDLFPFYWLASVLAGDTCRVVPVYHGIGPILGVPVRSSLGERVRGRVARMVSASVAVSKGTASAVERRFRVRPDTVHVVSNPIDVSDARAKATGREPVVFEGKHPVVLAVARLSPPKDWETLIAAFGRVAAVTLANLCIVGEGGDRERVTRMAQDAGIADRVILAGNQSNPFAYMSHADAFVLCSHYEAFGMVILEAMACGVPVIATDCESGPREVIGHGRNGLLVAPEDPAALATAILAVLADAELANHLRRGGLERADEFSLHDAVESYRQIAEHVRASCQ